MIEPPDQDFDMLLLGSYFSLPFFSCRLIDWLYEYACACRPFVILVPWTSRWDVISSILKHPTKTSLFIIKADRHPINDFCFPLCIFLQKPLMVETCWNWRMCNHPSSHRHVFPSEPKPSTTPSALFFRHLTFEAGLYGTMLTVSRQRITRPCPGHVIGCFLNHPFLSEVYYHLPILAHEMTGSFFFLEDRMVFLFWHGPAVQKTRQDHSQRDLFTMVSPRHRGRRVFPTLIISFSLISQVCRAQKQSYKPVGQK